VIHTNVNGILGENDDFQSVWSNVAEIRDLLIKCLDPLATFEFMPYGFILSWAAAIILGNVIFRWWRRRRRE
jgi:hypothetical protein